MNIAHTQKIFTGLFFFIISFCYGQKPVDLRLEMAIDSLDANPAYSHVTLSKISKDRENADSTKAKAKLYLGAYFNSTGVIDSSIYYTRASLLHLRGKKYRAQAYRQLGSCFRRTGMIDEAVEILLRSIKVSEEIGYIDMISKAKSDLGILYLNQQEYDRGIKYLKESIDIAESEQAVYGNYVNIGVAYFLLQDYDNAEKYYFKASTLIPPEKDPKTSAIVTLNLGIVNFKKEKYGSAIAYFDKSKEIADEHGLVDKSLHASNEKALVDAILGNTEKAIATLKNNLIKANELANLEIQKNIYENLGAVYKKANEYELANDALLQFYTFRDSLNNIKQRKEIIELEVKYETATKEKEILLLKENQLVKDNEIKKQRLLKQIYVIGFIVILIPVIGLLLLYYQKLQVKNKYNAQKEEINKQKTAAFLKEQELKITNKYVIAQNEERSRIARELHDSIGGNLAAIKLQVVNILKNKDKQNTVIDQIDETYDQVREISHNLIPKKISQTAFTNYIRDYIDTIEKVCDPTITFIPHPAEKIDIINDNQKAEIFKIIQELMTNALKHAKAKMIEICLNAYNDSIEIIFEDDGVGFDRKKGAGGIGLQNIKERLLLLKAHIDIDSAINRGTAIRIKIPTIINDKK